MCLRQFLFFLERQHFSSLNMNPSNPKDVWLDPCRQGVTSVQRVHSAQGSQQPGSKAPEAFVICSVCEAQKMARIMCAAKSSFCGPLRGFNFILVLKTNRKTTPQSLSKLGGFGVLLWSSLVPALEENLWWQSCQHSHSYCPLLHTWWSGYDKCSLLQSLNHPQTGQWEQIPP